MHTLFSLDSLTALITLTAMEIVLGIDNIVFLTLLVIKLPHAQQRVARKLGISLALLTRLALLLSISWIMSLTTPLFTIFGKDISGRDLILLGGGLFLMAKATFEIHEKIESGPDPLSAPIPKESRSNFISTLIQIILLDIVFSLDSVITAVGMAQHIPIMVVAMVIAVLVMLFSSEAIGSFILKHPTIKILALSFLLLIGVMLFAEGTGAHIGKGYIYFAMSFSLGVELLNMSYQKKHSRIPKSG